MLGWNAYFKDEWGIASWNCCVKGTLYESGPEGVTTGDTIFGEVVNQCSAGVLECGKWKVKTKDLSFGAYSDLYNESNFGQTFNWGFGAGLEVYSVKRCSDYPAGGALESYDVTAYNDKSQKITPTWFLEKSWLNPPLLSPVCNYGFYSDGGPSAMTLTY